MPTFIQEGFGKTRRRKTRSRGDKRAKMRRTSACASRTSKAISDSLRFPMTMASVGAGIAAFKAVTS